MAQATPHFVTDYQRMVRRMLASGDRDKAMADAVGGDYDGMGARQRELLAGLGLSDGHFIIDAGCGSGRLASALFRNGPKVKYLGLDVVPELLEYARQRAPSADWRFEQVNGLSIPVQDAAADFVVFFSVLTHLTDGESAAYLQEAARALKPGGKIVASFLDPADYSTWYRLRIALSQALHQIVRHTHMTTFTTKVAMLRHAEQLGMQATLVPSDAVGQHICVMTKATY